MTTVHYDCWQPDEDIEVIVTHDHPVELEQATTIIKVTDEGIIIDFYSNGEITGTIGMTYDEWFDMSQRGHLINEEAPE